MLEIGLHQNDLVTAVAVEIGEPGLKIFKHGVVLQPHGVALAVARLDHQTAGFDLVAENAVVVTAGRLGQPGAGDVALAGDNAAVRQCAVRQIGLRHSIDEVQRGAVLGGVDPVPEPAGIDAGLAVDRFNRGDPRRRGDALYAPFGRPCAGGDK